MGAGDLPSSTDEKRSAGQIAGIVMGSMAVVALVLFSQYIFVQSRNQYSNLSGGPPHLNNGSATVSGGTTSAIHTPFHPAALMSMANGSRRRTPAALFSWGMSRNSIRWDKEKRQARIRLVQKNIICKKVLPLSSAKMSTTSSCCSVIDCHLSTGSYHSWLSKGHNDDVDDDDISASVECGSLSPPRGGGRKMTLQQKVHRKGNNHRKDHMYIDCSCAHAYAAAAAAAAATPTSIHSLRHGMKVASSHHSLYSPRCCSVCYEEYKIGDDIAWSWNDECPHVYHLQCILEWLLDNDDCPMCRAKYIIIDVKDMEEEEEEVEEDASSPAAATALQEFPISVPIIQVPMGNDENVNYNHSEEELEEQEEAQEQEEQERNV
jgi:Component of SCF ubiquitin ligase and anaphase-promoting complex